MKAAERGDASTVRLFLRHRIDPKVKTLMGDTAADIARRKSCGKIVEMPEKVVFPQSTWVPSKIRKKQREGFYMSAMKVLIDMFKEEAKDNEGWFRPFLERRDAIQGCMQNPHNSPEEVWKAIWEGQNNGICGLGLGYTKRPFTDDQNSQINLQQLHKITQDTYQTLQQDPLNYNALRGCLERFIQLANDNQYRQYRSMFYRAVCGLDPKARFSVVVAENKWWYLYPYLQKVSGNALLPSGDWFETNVSFTEWFDQNHRNDLMNAIAGTALAGNYEIARCIFTWYLYELLTRRETFLPAKIYYGAPGTGKTYKACREGKLSFQHWAKLRLPDVCTSISLPKASDFVMQKQFHPSYGYENFIEGLMPVTTSQGTPHFDLIDGDFKYFCRKAGVLEIWLFECCNKMEVTVRTTLGDLHQEMSNHKNWPSELSDVIQRFAHGKNNSLANFWQEYCKCLYEALGTNKSLRSERLVDYLPPFTFVADEINRADLSRVLGETMYCLEYRGAGGRVRTQYALLADSDPQKKKGFCYQGDESWFFVPHNVYFIGTMNEIDRNIEIFDLALRRRFTFVELEFGKEEMREILRSAQLNSSIIEDLIDRIEKVNEKISKDPELGPAYQIGQGYFTHLQQPGYSNLSSANLRRQFWNEHLKPLVTEYLRGHSNKNAVLEELERVFVQ